MEMWKTPALVIITCDYVAIVFSVFLSIGLEFNRCVIPSQDLNLCM